MFLDARSREEIVCKFTKNKFYERFCTSRQNRGLQSCTRSACGNSINSAWPVEFSLNKIGEVDIFVLVKFENKLDKVINHFSFNSKHHEKFNLHCN